MPGDRPRSRDPREIVDAILYVVRGGGTWRMRPHDLLPWQTAYYSFRRWQANAGAPWAGFGWFGRYRRLSKEYEQRAGSSEAMIRIAMIHLMLPRLSRTDTF